jgi:hypothetical protein
MTGYLEDLERLGRLREQKVLSDAEFDAEKSRILAAQRTAQAAGDEVWQDALKRPLVWGSAGVLLVVAAAIYLGTSSVSNSSAGEVAQSDPVPATAPANRGEVRLSQILKFDVPSECAPGDDLKVLIDDMRSLEPGARKATLSVGGASIHPRVQRTALKDGQSAIIAELTAPGSLAGLKVTGLRSSRFDGTQMYTTQIRFDESPDKTLRVLNGEGFDLPKVGELKSVDLENGALMLGVEGIDGGSALTCARV